MNRKTICTVAISCVMMLPIQTKAEPLVLADAIDTAIKNDLWLKTSTYQQSAIEAKSKFSATQVDPVVSISAMNIPTDSWELDQEAMTQLKVGISQNFARGDSLEISRQQLAIEASKYPLMRANRNAQVVRDVTISYLNAYLAQETIRLINKDKTLFEQMVDIAGASYSSAYGNTRQQDVIKAQLALLRLDDRLMEEEQKLAAAKADLAQWFYQTDNEKSQHYFRKQIVDFKLDETLPRVRLNIGSVNDLKRLNTAKLSHQLSTHPVIEAVAINQKVAAKGIDLANQQYQPQWGVNASYGYRDDAPNGSDRSDFFSVGVTFDLPIFTENKQDHAVAASIAKVEAVKTEKLLLIREMMAALDKEIQSLDRLRRRQQLYQTQLITQTHEQAEAALTAYTNDDGDFSEVISARITELDTTIAKAKIDIETLATLARINYFFPDNRFLPEKLVNPEELDHVR